MTQPAIKPKSDARSRSVLVPRMAALLAMSTVLGIGGAIVPSTIAAVGFLAAASGLLGLAAVLAVLRLMEVRSIRSRHSTLSRFVEHDASPSFTTDNSGVIRYQNEAAVARFGDKLDVTLIAVLGGQFASPSAVLFRLQSRATDRGAAREDVVLRRGHMRISVHRLEPDGFLWRLESIAERSVSRGGDGISLPMLTASRSGTVLYMNDAMKRLVGGREMLLDRIIHDLPIRPGQVHKIAGIDGIVRAQVIELDDSGARRELYFLPSASVPAANGWTLLEALPVPLLRIASTGEILGSNRMARNLLEIEAGATPVLSELVTGLGRPVAEWLADAADGRGSPGPEVVRAARPPVDVFLQITLGRVEDDEDMTFVAVLHDATELKTLEAQFVQSQKMQAIGQLAGGVAHDFNNLLTAISGHCDLLLLKRDPGHPDYADLEQINQNANRAASLVSQLLAFSRKQNLQPELLDLRDTLSDLAHLLNRLVGEKITLHLTHDPALRLVRADKRQLEQVLMNLVVNARDAMPKGGNISIVTEGQTIATALRRDRAIVPPGDYVVVRVADQGIGIPSDKLPKIFEPFFTTKKTGEGTGLGLSTAYGIVKQTGGFIFADSTPGIGSTFTILLPAHDRPLPEAQARPAAPPPQATHGDGVVLLVEDEAPVRAFASRALRMRGFTVVEAENAEEALSKLEDDSLAIDVFVTDVIMPGMDGPSWVSKALESRPATRVVFVSGYSEDSLADSRNRIPNSVFLPKPFSLNELTATVQAQMH